MVGIIIKVHIFSSNEEKLIFLLLSEEIEKTQFLITKENSMSKADKKPNHPPDKYNVDPSQNEARRNLEVHIVLICSNTGTLGYVLAGHEKLWPSGSNFRLA